MGSGYEHRSAVDGAPLKPVERLVRLAERVDLHGAANRDGRGELQELAGVVVSHIGD